MNCLDEGLLQALIDGELSAERAGEAEAHLASCRACAEAAEAAAQEFALFSSAFAVAEPPAVPTERLRAGVASAVAEMRAAQATPAAAPGVAAREPSAGGVRSFWSSLAASFAPRRIAAFASLALAAVVLAATFFALRPGPRPATDERPESAQGTGAPPPTTGATVANHTPSPAGSGAQGDPGGTAAGETAKIRPRNAGPELAKNQPKPGPPQLDKTGPKTPRPIDRSAGQLVAATPGPKTPRPDLLPVERQYVREIAALKTSIERRQMRTLSPTLRAEYERNVAVVDEAIASTRAAARSNPKDRDAQEFLRSAYQEKLDLLSAVAGKSQLAVADR